jgi:uncharacterized protein (DUF2267 family)
MHATGLKEFDHAIHSANTWLKDLMVELDWEDRHRAYHALRAVLHTLRDRLPPNSVLHLSAQMPMLVRGIFLEGWRLVDNPVLERSEEEFVEHVAEAFSMDFSVDPRDIVVGVFNVLAKHVSAGEIENIKATLPAGIRKLWW